jgi:ethanolamine utilization protein EutN
MILAKVIGNIVSTVKHECYARQKLLLVRPLTPDGKMKSDTLVAVDTVGAGKGDTVLVAAEGKAAMEILKLPRRSPVREIIVGIVDCVDWKSPDSR